MNRGEDFDRMYLRFSARLRAFAAVPAFGQWDEALTTLHNEASVALSDYVRAVGRIDAAAQAGASELLLYAARRSHWHYRSRWTAATLKDAYAGWQMAHGVDAATADDWSEGYARSGFRWPLGASTGWPGTWCRR